MNTSTALRIRMVKKMVADLYEPGRQDRNKQWVLRTAVAPLLGISRRTFTRYLHTSDADVARALGSGREERQLSLFPDF